MVCFNGTFLQIIICILHGVFGELTKEAKLSVFLNDQDRADFKLLFKDILDKDSKEKYLELKTSLAGTPIIPIVDQALLYLALSGNKKVLPVSILEDMFANEASHPALKEACRGSYEWPSLYKVAMRHGRTDFIMKLYDLMPKIFPDDGKSAGNAIKNNNRCYFENHLGFKSHKITELDIRMAIDHDAEDVMEYFLLKDPELVLAIPYMDTEPFYYAIISGKVRVVRALIKNVRLQYWLEDARLVIMKTAGSYETRKRMRDTIKVTSQRHRTHAYDAFVALKITRREAAIVNEDFVSRKYLQPDALPCDRDLVSFVIRHGRAKTLKYLLEVEGCELPSVDEMKQALLAKKEKKYVDDMVSTLLEAGGVKKPSYYK